MQACTVRFWNTRQPNVFIETPCLLFAYIKIQLSAKQAKNCKQKTYSSARIVQLLAVMCSVFLFCGWYKYSNSCTHTFLVFIFFCLETKETKIQERTPNSIFIRTCQPAICYKNKISHRSSTSAALLPTYVCVLPKTEKVFFKN